MSDTKRPRLAHVSLVVNDIHEAIEDYRKLLEIVDPAGAEDVAIAMNSRAGDDVWHVATFFNPNGCEIQLMQPVEGPLARRLEKRGEHVHHICFVTDDLEETVERLKAADIPLASEEIVSDLVNDTWQSWTFVDHRFAHGPLIELARPYRTVNGKWVPA